MSTADGWEVFNKRSASTAKVPTVTMQKRGTISMNSAAAVRIAGVETPEGLLQVPVELLYNRKTRMIGIRQATSDHLSVYFMRKQKNSDSYILAARKFTQHYGIDTEISRRYKLREVADGVLGFGLDDEHTVVARDASEEADATDLEEQEEG